MIVLFFLTIYLHLSFADTLLTQENNFKRETDDEIGDIKISSICNIDYYNFIVIYISTVAVINYNYQVVNNNYHELYFNNIIFL